MYSQQLRIVKRFKVPEGVTRRFDCPFCGHRNTLGVSNISGVLEWHCFSASCVAKGIHDEGSTIAGIKERISSGKLENNSVGRDIPLYLTHISQQQHIDYLKSVHSYEAYEQGLIDVRYAPAEDRILFPVSNGKGYSGRRLDYTYDENGLAIPKKSYGPKWIKYGDTSHLFTCGNGSIGVLVEDAPSGCAVGVLPEYTGLSLLGTVLTSQHKIDILAFDRIIVCLDPDAASKGIELSSKLQGLRPTTVKFLPDDLKYYNPSEIKEILQ